MSKYRESGISIDLTNHPHCRLKDCKLHQELSHYYFKEADFIWWDAATDCIYISDFKDLSQMKKEKDIQDLIPNLVQKSIHVLSVFSSVWLQFEGGKPYSAFFPAPLKVKQKIRIMHIVNCPPEFNAYFSFVNTQFRSRFYAFEHLFDIDEALILNLENARKYLSPVQ